MEDILNKIMLSQNAADAFNEKAKWVAQKLRCEGVDTEKIGSDVEKAFAQPDGTLLLSAELPNGYKISQVVPAGEWCYQN